MVSCPSSGSRSGLEARDAAGLVALWSWQAGDIAALPTPPASVEEAVGTGWGGRRAGPAAVPESWATGDHVRPSVTSDSGDPGDTGW